MDLRILEIASNTENNKVLDNFTHQSKNKNSICGDEMEIKLIIENDKVIDMGYQCKSCVYCQASVSLLSQRIKNKKLDEIKYFIHSCENIFENTKIVLKKDWKDFIELLDKKNATRKECLLLPLRTVLKALRIS
jgi:nitrogen fixation protein NifU and related proteins